MAGCYDCGLEYSSPAWIEALVPDRVWERIKPEGCGKGAGLLCISCMSARMTKMEIKSPVWFTGLEPLVPMKGDPSDNPYHEWLMHEFVPEMYDFLPADFERPLNYD